MDGLWDEIERDLGALIKSEMETRDESDSTFWLFLINTCSQFLTARELRRFNDNFESLIDEGNALMPARLRLGVDNRVKIDYTGGN